MRYSIDEYDAHDNLLEVLGHVADRAVAHAAFEAAVAKISREAHLDRDGARVIRSGDQPRWA